MPRTLRLPLLVVAASLLAACSTLGLVGALLGDRISFTAPQLQQQLDRRFPRDYDKLGGLVTLSVLHPRLSIPPGSRRLRVDFDVGIGTPGCQALATGSKTSTVSTKTPASVDPPTA